MWSSTLVDELGYLPFEAHAAHLFFQLVSRRYERGSMLITSNRSVGEWGEVFGDAVVATAIPAREHRHDHTTDTVASTDRDSRSRAGPAPRRPSAGVAVVRRVGPLQRGTGRVRRRSTS